MFTKSFTIFHIRLVIFTFGWYHIDVLQIKYLSKLNYYCYIMVFTLSTVGVVIATQPMDQYINVSEDTTFMCEATGSPPISYQWLYNGIELMDQLMYVSGASTSTLMVTNANVSQWGNYSCVASNEVDSATSDVAVLHSKQMVL